VSGSPESSAVPLEDLLTRRLEQIEALGRIAHALTEAEDATRSMELVGAEGIRVFRAERAGVFLFEAGRRGARGAVAIGLSSRFSDAVERILGDEGSVREILQAGPRFILDAPADPDFPLAAEAATEGFVSMALLPLIFGGEPMGALMFCHDRPRTYGPEERRLATAFADQAALAIGKSRLLDMVSRVKREWQSTFDGTGSGLALVEVSGRVIRANRFVAALAGVPVTSLPGYDLRALFAEWPAPEQDPLWLAESGKERVSRLLQSRDGRVLVLTATPRADGGVVAAIDDVTPERLTQEALERSEARFRALFAAAPVAIFTTDADHRFQAVNQAAMGLAGVTQPAPGRLLEDFLSARERDPVRAQLDACLQGESRQYTMHFQREDGALREAAAISVPVAEARGGRSVLTIARDITEERELRDRLEHTERMAALGQLVSGAAHELNNPLAGIAALAQAMSLDPATGEEGGRVAQMIRREAVRAARIVGDLLTFARQRPLRRHQTDLNVLVSEAVGQVEPELQWELALEAGLPPISADPEQLRQVLTNLLTNAAHAMQGAPRRVGRVRTWSTAQIVGCEVTDTGPGIPPEVMPRLFEPFFTTKGVGEGTGLGLSISHGIIRAHGGEIRAQNRPEGGARFWFELSR
jgi:PAS domain S-box-containing protein